MEILSGSNCTMAFKISTSFHRFWSRANSKWKTMFGYKTLLVIFDEILEIFLSMESHIFFSILTPCNFQLKHPFGSILFPLQILLHHLSKASRILPWDPLRWKCHWIELGNLELKFHHKSEFEIHVLDFKHQISTRLWSKHV